VKLLEDNSPSIALAINNKNSPKTKHIKVKYHFIREAVQNNEVFIEHIGAEHMLADILTKPLGKNLQARFTNNLLTN
jgi:hypothetical protein